MVSTVPSWTESVVWVAYAIWAGWIFWFDATTRRIPNNLTGPPAVVTAVLTCVLPGWHPWQLIGGVIWAGFIVVAPILNSRMTVGGGDAKLAFTLGTLAMSLGFWGLWIAMAVTGAVGVGISMVVTANRKDPYTPHGPAMILGTSAVVVGMVLMGS
ncbi:prepilin peptidase [Corynebacterium sp. HMSC28B08]|uniref:prepilin peptidase n=1 Tax=Corynebacterium TaxID=1716 RepID=UPI000B012771|nr:prepilin peptidase [Corynebacterium sp. HMSC28B08]